MAIEKQERLRESLAQKLAQTEKDLHLALKQEQQAHEEDVERISREKEQQRCDLESRREEIIHSFNLEKEELTNKFLNEKDDLEEELAALQRDRDEQLLIAENDKQQVGLVYCTLKITSEYFSDY